MIRYLVLGLIFTQTAATSAIVPDTIGAWTIERNKDSKTDAMITSAHVLGNGMRIDYGCNSGHGAPAMLIITSKNFLGGVQRAGIRPATFTADSGHPVLVKMRYDENTATARYSESLRPVKAALTSGRSLSVRLLTQSWDPVDASFDVTGARNALAVVDRACESIAATRH